MQSKSYHRYRVVLLVETSREIGRGLLHGVMRYEREHGPWGLHIMPGDVSQRMPMIRAWNATGIIARIMSPAELLRTNLPTVAVSLPARQRRPGAPLSHLPNVCCDGDLLGRTAAEHLIACGLRNFAYVPDTDNSDWSRWREKSFSLRVAEAGGMVAVYPGPHRSLPQDIGREYIELTRWLKTLPKPVGIMAAVDVRGREVITACIQGGLRVPDDVAVIGVDNDELFCKLCDPPLTSVAVDSERAGYDAAGLLHRMMQGESVGAPQIFLNATHVVARESTNIVVHDDQVAAEALRFIRLRANGALQISDVAEHVGLSRRALEMRFRKSVRSTILSEITAVRLEYAMSLLRETTLPVEKVAGRCGFANGNYFTKVFRHARGLSPSVYRRQFLEAFHH